MSNVYWACGFVLVCIAFYRFGLPWLKRFDQTNVARIAQQERDKADANAHIRHALDVANEQVEEIKEIKVGAATHYLFEAQVYASPDEQVEEVQEIKVGDVTHFLFEAEVFSSREDAEDMRARRVGVVARRFYEELPAALMGRGEGGPRSPVSARERAGQRWKQTIH